MTNYVHETTRYFATHSEYKAAAERGERNIAYDASRPGTEPPLRTLYATETSAWGGMDWRDRRSASK